MTMTPWVRKFALTIHVTTSVGLLGAIAGFLALAIVGLTGEAPAARSSYPAMELMTWAVVLPLALLALLGGIIQSLGTIWGLFRHYWVLFKLVLTVIASVVLLMQLGNIGYVAAVAVQSGLAPGELFAARVSLVAHAAGGLVVLLVPMVLSIYKPRGRTRLGRILSV